MVLGTRAVTDGYEGMTAHTVSVRGYAGDWVHAYLARPDGAGPYPAVVVLHHRPGWDEWHREVTRRFAHHGYVALCPDLYCRDGHGDPDDVAAHVRAGGGPPDERVVEDVRGSVSHLRAQPFTTGRVAAFGVCSGGRHAVLSAAAVPEVAAVVNCWGGGVVEPVEDGADPTPPSYLDELRSPMLGIFGNDDKRPSPLDVDVLEAALSERGIDHDFHRYDGAGPRSSIPTGRRTAPNRRPMGGSGSGTSWDAS